MDSSEMLLPTVNAKSRCTCIGLFAFIPVFSETWLRLAFVSSCQGDVLERSFPARTPRLDNQNSRSLSVNSATPVNTIRPRERDFESPRDALRIDSQDSDNLVRRAFVTTQAESLRRLTKAMNQFQPNNPLHGVTLKAILEYLVAEYGWQRLGDRINIHCFNYDPSINSSLKFLRKSDWARARVERLYLDSISYDKRKGKNNPDANVEPSETGSVWDRARKD